MHIEKPQVARKNVGCLFNINVCVYVARALSRAWLMHYLLKMFNGESIWMIDKKKLYFLI